MYNPQTLENIWIFSTFKRNHETTLGSEACKAKQSRIEINRILLSESMLYAAKRFRTIEAHSDLLPSRAPSSRKIRIHSAFPNCSAKSNGVCPL